MSPPKDESEWRRTLTAEFMAGSQQIHLNNANTLDSSALAAALTSIDWTDRVVGSSRQARPPITCRWVATGNNPRLSKEIARRAVPIRLDAGIERPADRNFEVPDLLKLVLTNRAKYVRHVLIIVQAWIAAGRPNGSATFGSFVEYASVLGGILENAGRVLDSGVFDGFISNRRR